MNILRIFGIVAALHAFALLLIFANPGCSSSVAKVDTAPAAAPAAPESSPMISAPLPTGAAPLAPATDTSAPAPAAGMLYSPTRPGTPAAAALETQPVTDVTPAATYTVGKGDSLWSIAKKNHLRVSELATANSLKAGATLRQGQKLLIPAKAVGSKPSSEPMAETPAPAATIHAAAPAKGPSESFKYKVKPGETLGAIAHRFGVRTGDLATKNAISDPQKIRPGQELTIPGNGHSSARSPKPVASGAGPSDAGAAARTDASASGLPSGLSPAPASGGPVPAPDTNPSPAAPMSEVPVIKIDPASPGPADQPKSP